MKKHNTIYTPRKPGESKVDFRKRLMDKYKVYTGTTSNKTDQEFEDKMRESAKRGQRFIDALKRGIAEDLEEEKSGF